MTDTVPIRIVLAERSSAVRQGLRMYLGLQRCVTIAAETEFGAQAAELCAAHAPDVVVVDCFLPDMTGAEAVARILARMPLQKILMFGTLSEPSVVAQSLLAGAAGYVTKRSSVDTLIAAIAAVGRGLCPVDAHVADDLLRELQPPAGRARLEAADLAALRGLPGDQPLRLLNWPLSAGMRAALTGVPAVAR